ncbi:MAG: Formyltetrahydrofolate deformylase [Brockia lithotrophica]|uniref:Formyltetrahydrofolate deformylase n=1 Tax=Brockia lithotrophica TaxID=933949 RepID=A0A2T5G520_9BACL|nr:formyltetrahydrofolate deformylase [Brockia lithotrophica]PTQ51280.1 MAG: Formyltetrahydrofolate deformylase [Brockia lithotrophica]
MEADRARILLTCVDRPGIVANVAGALSRLGANIVELDQHTTAPWGGRLFMRVEFLLPGLEEKREELEKTLREVSESWNIDFQLHFASRRKRVVVFASLADHALLELLHLWRNGELPGDLVAVVSNHTRLAHAVTAYGVPYHHVPVERGKKEEAERAILDLLEGYRPDLLVLARYMQILSPEFVRRFPNRIINIHHSFLPAFVGKNPYEQAFARGVKLIGATAHYVTEGLDEGPIIEQDVARVTHRASLATLKQIGRDIERTVLARAVKWHLEDRILVHENKTIVFV